MIRALRSLYYRFARAHSWTSCPHQVSHLYGAGVVVRYEQPRAD